MKDIGYTEGGGRLVEMNQQEYLEFQKLCSSVEGKSHPFHADWKTFAFQEGYDFTKTFEVIRAFYTVRFRLNEFQNTLNEIQESFNRV